MKCWLKRHILVAKEGDKTDGFGRHFEFIFSVFSKTNEGDGEGLKYQ